MSTCKEGGWMTLGPLYVEWGDGLRLDIWRFVFYLRASWRRRDG